MARRVVVLLNAGAGGARDEALHSEIADALRKHAVDGEIRVVREGKTIPDLAREAIESGCFAVVAAGGDGTVSAVASAVAGTDAVLGVLPVGTLNHFAKDAGIPLSVDDAVATIASGRVRRVDLGEVNGRTFVNNSSLGLYPSLVRKREREQRLGRSKWVAFFWACLAVLRRYRFVRIRVACDDGRTLTRHTPLVFIGNNPYEMSGFEIGSRPALDGGRLAVYVVRGDNAFRLLRMGIEAVFGRLRHGADFDLLSTETAQIELRRRAVHVATDGEVTTLVPPLVYRVRPGALGVLVPQGPDPAGPDPDGPVPAGPHPDRSRRP